MRSNVGWPALALLGLLASGCPGSSAQEMLDTARLEERQDNAEHAEKLYRQILDEHPDSPESEIARERLEALSR